MLTILDSVSRFLLICTLYRMVSAEGVVNAFTGLHSTKHPSVVMLVTRGGADKDTGRLLIKLWLFDPRMYAWEITLHCGWVGVGSVELVNLGDRPLASLVG